MQRTPKTESQLISIIKYEFTKRTTNIDQIIQKSTDEFISRYSSKHNYNSDFFKIDLGKVMEQLTICHDQFVDVLRKFQFMGRGLEIFTVVFLCFMKMVGFLEKELSNVRFSKVMSAQFQEKYVNSMTSRCDNCANIKQSEAIKCLKQQLTNTNNYQKFLSENPDLDLSRDQKKNQINYDDQISKIELMNETQMRNKLKKMQFDNDRQKNDIMIALKQLDRFNDKIVQYGSRKIKDKGMEKFNVKNYTFNLGKYFLGNLNGIQQKIKEMKQKICPTINKEIQTEEPTISLKQHTQQVNKQKQAVKQITLKFNQITKTYKQTQKSLKLEKDMVKILETKMKELLSENQQVIGQKEMELAHSHLLKKKLSVIDNMEEALKKRNSVKSSNRSSLVDIHSAKIFKELDEIEEQIILLSTRKSHKIQTYKGIQDMHGTLTFRTLKTIMNLDIINKQKEQRLRSASTNLTNLKGFLESITQTINIEEKLSAKKNIGQIQNFIIKEGQDLQIMKKLEKQQKKVKKYSYEKVFSIMIKQTGVQQSSENTEKTNNKNTKKTKILLKKQKKQPEEFQQFQKISKRTNYASIQGTPRNVDLQRKKSTQIPEIMTKEKKKFALKNFQKHSKNDGVSSINKKYQKRRYNSHIYEQQSEKQNRNLESFTNLKSVHEKFEKRSNFKLQDLIFSEEKNKILTTPFQSRNSSVGKNQQKADIPFQIKKKIKGYKGLLTLQQLNYSTYFFGLLATLHLKDVEFYHKIKEFLFSSFLDKDILVCLKNEAQSQQIHNMKQAVNKLLIMHRKCQKNGGVCNHLQNLVSKMKEN